MLVRRTVLALVPLGLSILFAGCSKSGGGASSYTFAKSFGGALQDEAAIALPLPSGGYLAAGTTAGRTSGRVAGEELDADLWVAELDAAGDVVWERVLGDALGSSESVEQSSYVACEATDGGAWLVGHRWSTRTSTGDALVDGGNVVVTKLAPNGQVQWVREHDSGKIPGKSFFRANDTADDVPKDVCATADGGVLVSCIASALVEEGPGAIVARVLVVMELDPDGELRWLTHVVDDGDGHAVDDFRAHLVRETADGDVLAVSSDWTTRFDTSGIRLWTEEGPGGSPRDVLALDDAGCLVVGVEGARARAWEISADGEVEWEKSYPYRSLERIAHGSVDGGGGAAELGFGVVAQDPHEEGVEGAAFLVLLDRSGDEVASSTFHDVTGALRYDDDADQWWVLGWREIGGNIGLARLGAFGVDAGLVTQSEDAMEVAIPPRCDVTADGGALALGNLGPDRGWGLGRERRLRRWDADLLVAFDVSLDPAVERKVERAQGAVLVDDDLDGAADDGALVLAAVRTHASARGVPWLVRLGADGELLWDRVLPEVDLAAVEPPDEEHGVQGFELFPADVLVAMRDGGFALAAELRTEDGGARVLSLDPAGAVRWISEPIAPAESGERVRALRACPSGAIVVVGGDWYRPGWVARIAESGVFEWGRRVAPLDDWNDLGLEVLADDGLLLGVAGGDLWLARLDATGAELWSRRYAHPDWSMLGATSIVALAGNELAVGTTAEARSFEEHAARGRENELALRLDVDGTPEWFRVLGGLAREELLGVRALDDGGLLLAGRSESMGELQEAWIVRTGPDGTVSEGCNAELEGGAWPGTVESSIWIGDAYAPAFGVLVESLESSARALAPREVAPLTVARQCFGVPTIEEPPDPPPPPSGDGYTLTVAFVAPGHGRVTSVPEGIACESTCSASFPAGTEVLLVPTPLDGSFFSHWSGADEDHGIEGCIVRMTSDRAVEVYFE